MLLAQMVVEYSADTRKLATAVQDTGKQQKIMQDSAARATSSMSSGFRDATSSAQSLADKAKAAGLDISKLAQAENQAREAAAKHQLAVAQAANALKKADDMAKSGKASEEQLAVAYAHATLAAEREKTAENNLAQSVQKVGTESKHLSSSMEEQAAKSSLLARGLDGAKSSMARLASVAATVAKVALVALAGSILAVVAAIGTSIPKAMEFDATLRKINALAGISSDKLGQVSDTILNMAGKIGKGPQDLADGFYYIASAGFDASKSMQLLEQSGKAASVGMTQTQVVADAATASLKAFPALSVAQEFDIMTKTVATGKLEWDSYASNIGKAALSASEAGASFQEANAAFAVLSNVMPSAEQSATALNALFLTSSKISDLTDRANSLGLSFDANAYKSMNFIDRLKYLQQITNGNSEAMYKLLGQQEAMPAITALLTNGAQDYASALDGITNSAGAADEAFKKTSGGAQAAWQRATASLDALQIKIGTALLPAVNAFSDKIAPMVARIIDWIDKTHVLENTVNTISAIVAQLTPIVMQLGLAISQLSPYLSQSVSDFQNFGNQVAGIFDAVSRNAQENTLKTQLSTVNTTINQKQALIKQYEDQKQQLYDQMEQTHNLVLRKAILTKIDVINAAEDQAKGVIRAAKKQKDGILQQMQQTDPVVAMHALAQKNAAISHSIDQMKTVIANYESQKQAIIDKMAHTHDAVKMQALKTQFDAINAAENQKKGVLAAYEQQQQGIQGSMQKVQGVINNDSSGNALIATWKQVQAVLSTVAGFLNSTFEPVWEQLVTVWNTQVVPSWNQLVEAFKPAIPLFQLIGTVIGVSFIVTLGILLSLLVGFIKAIANFIGGMAQALGGIAQVISGVLQIVSGIIAFFVDLFTGKFNNLLLDLYNIGRGVATIFVGMWQIISGVFIATIGTIISFVWGFITTIIGFFQNLWDKLVGHSIIPDMIKGITDWFWKLVEGPVDAVHSMIDKATGAIQDFAKKALDLGSNIVKNIGQGITNGIHFVQDGIGKVSQFISDHLPHSPAKLGPLRDLARQGSEIVNQVGRGMLAGVPALESTLAKVTKPIASRVSAIPVSRESGSGSNNNGGDTHIHIYMDGEDITDKVMKRVQKASRKGPIRQAGAA